MGFVSFLTNFLNIIVILSNNISLFLHMQHFNLANNMAYLEVDSYGWDLKCVLQVCQPVALLGHSWMKHGPKKI